PIRTKQALENHSIRDASNSTPNPIDAFWVQLYNCHRSESNMTPTPSSTPGLPTPEASPASQPTSSSSSPRSESPEDPYAGFPWVRFPGYTKSDNSYKKRSGPTWKYGY